MSASDPTLDTNLNDPNDGVSRNINQGVIHPHQVLSHNSKVISQDVKSTAWICTNPHNEHNSLHSCNMPGYMSRSRVNK